MKRYDSEAFNNKLKVVWIKKHIKKILMIVVFINLIITGLFLIMEASFLMESLRSIAFLMFLVAIFTMFFSYNSLKGLDLSGKFVEIHSDHMKINNVYVRDIKLEQPLIPNKVKTDREELFQKAVIYFSEIKGISKVEVIDVNLKDSILIQFDTPCERSTINGAKVNNKKTFTISLAGYPKGYFDKVYHDLEAVFNIRI